MPSSTLVAAAEAAPPLRRRQRRPFESVTLGLPVFRSLALPPRDWAGLPPELISCILHRLDHVQIMLGADKVCRSWRRAARDEPELWRRIDMRGYKAHSDRNLVDLNQMAVEAVRRSHGQCQEFAGEGYGLHDDFIHFLADHAPLLKRLILVWCCKLTVVGFMQSIKGFPLLEELHLSKCWYVQCAGVFEVIAKECPRLKHLVCDAHYPYYDGYGYLVEDGAAMAIAKMQELRSLRLINNCLTNQGLVAILDGCLHLRSLDILHSYYIHMTPEMEARIKTGKLLMNYSSAERWGEFDEPGNPTIECSTCHNYFEPSGARYQNHRYFGPGLERHQQIYPIDEKEAMVISAVCELRSLVLYRDDLTSKGLAAILDKFPHLEALDVWNCLNIAVDNNNALIRRARWHRIKTKKLTTKLLIDRSYHNVFDPKGLDMRYCRNLVMNSCHGRRVIMDSTMGAKYKRLTLRTWAKKYHKRTRKMKARVEQYLAKLLPGANIDYMEFEGAEFNDYHYHRIIFNPNECRFIEPVYRHTSNYYYYDYSDWEFDDVDFEPGSPTSECSTCLLFEYLAERWDLDDYSNYYEDSSYGHGIYDETEFQVHDSMLGKRFRRYLEME